jgi:predicted DNA-binding protein with PD1-like motif
MEVGNLSGTISREEDRPFIHLHAVVSPRELLAYTGHVHEAKVGAVLEVFVHAWPGRLDRKQASGQAFPALLLPGESETEGGPPTR